MKTFVVALAVALFTSGCNAQDHSEKGSDKKDLKNMPKESWTVKKELDENGNLIGYDSTYTWSYSTQNGDTLSLNVDSVMRSIKSYFSKTMPPVWDQSLMNPMLNDSLLRRDLFSDDYFYKRWKDDFFDMDKMFDRMDSVRNQFFKQNFPDMKPMNTPSSKRGDG